MTTAGSSLPGATRAAMATTPCTHQQVFPALAEQVGHARRFLAGLLTGYPMADEAVLCLSELASNTIIHSASRQPGGTFTVRAVIDDDGGVRVEVEDQGGLWGPSSSKNRQHGHGLHIVRQIACDWGITGDNATGRTVWFEL